MAGRYDIEATPGTTLARVLTWLDTSRNPVDLSGFGARMQVRAISDGTLYADLSTSAGGIVLGGTDGTIALTISGDDTTAFPPGVAKYDLFVTNAAGNTSRLLHGNFTVHEGVTRDGG